MVISLKPTVLTAIFKPAVPLLVDCAGQVLRFKPELSPPALAGSPGLPAAKVEDTPPIRDNVPEPVLGVVTPVLVAASGVVELKFHCEIVEPFAAMTVAVASNVVSMVLSFIRQSG